jgi:hypothetical protein
VEGSELLAELGSKRVHALGLVETGVRDRTTDWTSGPLMLVHAVVSLFGVSPLQTVAPLSFVVVVLYRASGC